MLASAMTFGSFLGRFALASVALVICSAASVSAQEAPAQPATSVPVVPAASVAVPSVQEIALAQEVLRLRVHQNQLLASNRRWEVPAIGLGVGVSSLVIGGIVFATAWSDTGYCYSSYGTCEGDDYNVARDRTGLVMMPLGAALVIASVPMLIVRVVRHKKLKRVERALTYLEQHASLEAGHGGLTFKF
jgi:hypothetical protein